MKPHHIATIISALFILLANIFFADGNILKIIGFPFFLIWATLVHAATNGLTEPEILCNNKKMWIVVLFLIIAFILVPFLMLLGICSLFD